MEYKDVTVADILDAMERNGFVQARGAWITYNLDGSVQRACAMGQAVINLGVDLSAFQQVIASTPVWNELRWDIMSANDRKRLSCKTIADKMRKEYSHILDSTMTLPVAEYKIREKKNV